MKRLYRSRYDRKFAGVCGGLAQYFNIDPVIFRIVFVLGTIGSTILPGLFVYLIMAIIIPNNPDE